MYASMYVCMDVWMDVWMYIYIYHIYILYIVYDADHPLSCTPTYENNNVETRQLEGLIQEGRLCPGTAMNEIQ